MGHQALCRGRVSIPVPQERRGYHRGLSLGLRFTPSRPRRSRSTREPWLLGARASMATARRRVSLRSARSRLPPFLPPANRLPASRRGRPLSGPRELTSQVGKAGPGPDLSGSQPSRAVGGGLPSLPLTAPSPPLARSRWQVSGLVGSYLPLGRPLQRPLPQ